MELVVDSEPVGFESTADGYCHCQDVERSDEWDLEHIPSSVEYMFRSLETCFLCISSVCVGGEHH